MSPAADPVFAAIQRVTTAHRAWSAATAAADAIKAKLAEENAAERAVVSIAFAGATIPLRSRKGINRIFRRARESQGGASSILDATEAQLLDAFERERERIAAAQERLGIAAADSQIAEVHQGLLAAQLAAARTVPTSSEGVRALIELANRFPVEDRNHTKAALASLRTAAVALLPQASR